MTDIMKERKRKTENRKFRFKFKLISLLLSIGRIYFLSIKTLV